jgi:hypothetical protein
MTKILVGGTAATNISKLLQVMVDVRVQPHQSLDSSPKLLSRFGQDNPAKEIIYSIWLHVLLSWIVS